ncbi:MAG: hypothetical protein NTY09_07775 [bacterium]|nr:hypothetical protein [bacterium]
MEDGIVTCLANEMDVTEDLALIAVTEANGEIDKAREIVKGLIPRYLFIKVKFIAIRKEQAGLIFLLTEKGRPDFILFRAIAETDTAWVNSHPVNVPPANFFNTIRKYFTEQTTGPKLFDSQQMRAEIAKRLNASALQYLFSLWDQPKTELIPESIPSEEVTNQVGPIINDLISRLLEDIFIDKIKVDLDYDFMTDKNFRTIAQELGLETTTYSAVLSQEDPEHAEGLKVSLKGQFMIDPVNGIPSQELKVNDSAYVEVLDRSELGVSIGKLIGAYRMGMWRPVRCRIEEIVQLTGERWRFRLKVTKGIFVDVLSYENILVRNKPYTRRITPVKAAEEKSEMNFMPLLVGIVVMIAIIVLLVILL